MPPPRIKAMAYRVKIGFTSPRLADSTELLHSSPSCYRRVDIGGFHDSRCYPADLLGCIGTIELIRGDEHAESSRTRVD